MNNIEDVILFQIDKTSKMSKIYSQRELDKLDFGLTIDQWILLKIIHETPAISQKELAKKSLRDPASITRTVDLLSKKNLLIRKSIPENRRKYSLELSDQGQKFVDQHIDEIKRHREVSTKGMTKREIQTLAGLLKKIQSNMI